MTTSSNAEVADEQYARHCGHELHLAQPAPRQHSVAGFGFVRSGGDDRAAGLAAQEITKAQLNLFLYQTVVNAAWRNLDMPRQVRPGEVAPLALNLHYLVTAYGRGETDNDGTSHRVLSGAMSVLHDHPVLGQSEIAASLPNNDLAEQFERLRITPLQLRKSG
jgi:hypothetical protein